MTDSRSRVSKAIHSSTTAAISPVPGPAAHSERKAPVTPSQTSSNATSHPKVSGISATSTASQVLHIVGEVSKAVGGVPYVEAITNIVVTLVKIREEVEANKKRCQEVLNKVLNKAERIFNHLLTLQKCGKHGDLKQLEAEMRRYHDFLADVLETVTKMQQRPLYQRILHRSTDELDRLERDMHDHDINLILEAVMKNLTNQAQNCGDSGGPQTSRIATHFPAAPVRILERGVQQRKIVAKLLCTPNVRVALLGMGGIGKTTLACSIARDPKIIKKYPHQIFLSFEGCSTADLAYANIAKIFDIPHDRRTSHGQILSQVRSYLSRKKTLLVIDNFETWWEVPGNSRDADDFLGQLASLQKLAMIVTLRGIQRPASTVIDWFQTKPLPTLTKNASMNLLSVFTKKKYANSELKYVRKLLDAGAGIPLAVNLIGSLLRDGIETPQSLWNRWTRESTQAIRVSNEVAADDRLYRLDISLRLSIFGPRMTEDARMLLAAISTLPLGLNMDQKWLDKYQTLLPDTIHVRDCVRTLQSVALATINSSTSPHRLRLLPPVRDFCLNNLSLDNEALHRLIDKYNTDLLDHSESESSENSDWVIAELGNITAILNRAITLRYVTDTFGHAIFHYNEWRRRLCMPETSTIKRAITILSARSSAKADCLQGLGSTRINFDHEQAIRPLEQALSIHRELGVKGQEGWDLYLLGFAHHRSGDYAKAEQCLNEARDRFIEIGDKRKQGSALNELSQICLHQNKLSQAECAAKTALKLSRASRHRQGEANALCQLGNVYKGRGKHGLAIKKLTASRDVSQATHDTQGEAWANESLGDVYRDIKKFDQAGVHYQLAASLYERSQRPKAAQRSQAELKKLGTSSNTSK